MNTRTKLVALLLALFSVTAVLALDAPAGATAHHATHHKHKHHHHKRHHHKKPKPKPVTTCPGYHHMSPRTVAIPDRQARSNSALYQAVDHLICSAANYSTIEIRGYYIEPNDGPVMDRINTHLALMHRYHHVRVNVLVQNNGFGLWRPAKRAMPFAHFYTCTYGCQSGNPLSKSHSKWITVSHLQYRNGTGVITLSANLSTQQFTNAEDGVLSIANHSLYEQVASHFASDAYCAGQPGHHCHRAVEPTSWHTTSQAGTRVYFAPTSSDLATDELDTLTSCNRGDTIYYASLGLPRSPIVKQLARLRQLGCTERLIVEHPTTPHPTISWMTHSEHDKLLVIDTHQRRVVLSGSECFTHNGLLTSDNIMLRLTQRAVVDSYVSYARWLWAGSYYVAPVAPVVAAAAAKVANATD